MSSELEFIVQVSMNCISIQNTYSPRLNPSFLFRILPCRFRSETESLRLQNCLLHRIHFRQCMTEKNVQLTCVCVCSYSYIDCIFISELLVRPVCSHVARRIRYVFQHINISHHTLLLIWHFLLLLPYSPPSLHLCSPSQTVFAQSTLAQWRELSFASLDSRTKRNWYIQVIHIQCTSFLSLGCTPYNVENIFPSPATYSIFHSFLALMSCTSTQTCPCMYLTASAVCCQELRSTVKVVHKHLSMHTCIVSNIVYPRSPACSMVSAPWPT